MALPRDAPERKVPGTFWAAAAGRAPSRLQRHRRRAARNVGIGFIMCLVSIFFLLVVLFNSVTQPFLIMVVIPFGFTGVIVGFALQGIELSMIAMIGILGLAGVLVNDSVVMIDALNRRKDEHRGPLSDDEIAEGANRVLGGHHLVG
ncbi:MAG: efflux RND transporter permease subunit [bacterium]|nr:efflux RND transporter permease subunit [bacterium]